MEKLLSNNNGLSKIIIILLFSFIAIVIGGVILIIIGSGGNTLTPKAVTIKIWGVWDDTSDLQSLFNSYKSAHPYITIKYTKIRFEEYGDLLLKGWATDTGPDIYAIPSSWITNYKTDFITPLPKSTKVAYYETKKVLFKTETVITVKTEKSFTAGDIRSNFIDVVYSDIVRDGAIYGLPFGIDTLVMYYNRELLNQASLAQPPIDWNGFTAAVNRLTIIDDQNDIIRAGTSLGTNANIPRAVDILTLLMLQNGTNMTAGKTITFQRPASGDSSYFPGQIALQFYTDFALPRKSVYTWNDQMPNALDHFAEGKLGFFFGYRFNEPEIQSKSRGVDYAIAAVPQVNTSQAVNFSNYWVYTVAGKTSNANEAWNFLQYASQPKRIQKYLTSTNQTSVLRALLNEQLADPATSVFAQQALTAKSWYQGRNPEEAENIFGEMIEAVLNETDTVASAINTAAQKIQQGY